MISQSDVTVESARRGKKKNQLMPLEKNNGRKCFKAFFPGIVENTL